MGACLVSWEREQHGDRPLRKPDRAGLTDRPRGRAGTGFQAAMSLIGRYSWR